MSHKENALRQIEEIHAIIKNNISAIISGKHIVLLGLGLTTIPFIEYALDTFIDPMLTTISPSFFMIYRVALRIFLYSPFLITLFLFGNKEMVQSNHILKKFFSFAQLLSLILLFVSISLATTEHTHLITPVLFIIIGTLLMVIRQFTLDQLYKLIGIGAWSLLEAGLVGILLSTLNISYLWAYLVLYIGICWTTIGCVLMYKERCKAISS